MGVLSFSSHSLLLHPLRVAVLKVSVTREGETTRLEDEKFVRVIGHDGKPSMPWKASTTFLKGDKVEAILGWFLVNPESLKALKLENEKVATEFHEFKRESFTF